LNGHERRRAWATCRQHFACLRRTFACVSPKPFGSPPTPPPTPHPPTTPPLPHPGYAFPPGSLPTPAPAWACGGWRTWHVYETRTWRAVNAGRTRADMRYNQVGGCGRLRRFRHTPQAGERRLYQHISCMVYLADLPVHLPIHAPPIFCRTSGKLRHDAQRRKLKFVRATPRLHTPPPGALLQTLPTAFSPSGMPHACLSGADTSIFHATGINVYHAGITGMQQRRDWAGLDALVTVQADDNSYHPLPTIAGQASGWALTVLHRCVGNGVFSLPVAANTPTCMTLRCCQQALHGRASRHAPGTIPRAHTLPTHPTAPPHAPRGRVLHGTGGGGWRSTDRNSGHSVQTALQRLRRLIAAPHLFFALALLHVPRQTGTVVCTAAGACVYLPLTFTCNPPLNSLSSRTDGANDSDVGGRIDLGGL